MAPGGIKRKTDAWRAALRARDVTPNMMHEIGAHLAARHDAYARSALLESIRHNISPRMLRDENMLFALAGALGKNTGSDARQKSYGDPVDTWFADLLSFAIRQKDMPAPAASLAKTHLHVLQIGYQGKPDHAVHHAANKTWFARQDDQQCLAHLADALIHGTIMKGGLPGNDPRARAAVAVSRALYHNEMFGIRVRPGRNYTLNPAWRACEALLSENGGKAYLSRPQRLVIMRSIIHGLNDCWQDFDGAIIRPAYTKCAENLTHRLPKGMTRAKAVAGFAYSQECDALLSRVGAATAEMELLQYPAQKHPYDLIAALRNVAAPWAPPASRDAGLGQWHRLRRSTDWRRPAPASSHLRP